MVIAGSILLIVVSIVDLLVCLLSFDMAGLFTALLMLVLACIAMARRAAATPGICILLLSLISIVLDFGVLNLILKLACILAFFLILAGSSMNRR